MAKMRDAIDAAKIYPRGDLEARSYGAVLVSFDYSDDGETYNIHVDQSSGSASLDTAAELAVARAKLPPKPAESRGVNHFVVTVKFGSNGP